MPVAQNGVHYGSPSHARIATSPSHSQPPVATHVHSHNRPLSPPSHNTVGLPPTPPTAHPHNHITNKPLPEAVIQTITQRVQNKTSPRRRVEERPSPNKTEPAHVNGEQERMLSVSGKKKCSHCGDELGTLAACFCRALCWAYFYFLQDGVPPWLLKVCVCFTTLIASSVACVTLSLVMVSWGPMCGCATINSTVTIVILRMMVGNPISRETFVSCFFSTFRCKV